MGTEDELRTETPPRRRRLPVVIAAAVLAVGGGTAYLADALTNGDPDGRQDTAGRSTAADSADPASADPGPIRLAEPPAAAGDALAPGAAGKSADPGGKRLQYRLDTRLPTSPDRAELLAVSAPEDGSEKLAARLGEALGLSADPVRSGASWRIGTEDGRLLVVQDAPGHPWTYRGKGTVSRVEEPPSDGSAPGSDGGRGGGAGDAPARGLSDAEALKKAKPVLSDIGAAGPATVTGTDAEPVRRVVSPAEAAGAPVHGWNHEVRVTADGVVGASGPTGKGLGTDRVYPLAPASEALETLRQEPAPTDPRCIGKSPRTPKDRPHAEPGAEPGAASGPSDTGIAPCGKLPTEYTVTGAELGRIQVWEEGGKPVLLPAWLFTVQAADTEGEPFVRAVPAVEQKYLKHPEPKDTVTREVAITDYAADGRTVTVRLTGGACETYRAKAVAQSGGRVEVSATESAPRDQVCIKIAKEHSIEVDLKEPLGDRKVVDEKTGKTVPRQKG